MRERWDEDGENDCQGIVSKETNFRRLAMDLRNRIGANTLQGCSAVTGTAKKLMDAESLCQNCFHTLVNARRTISLQQKLTMNED